MKTAILTSLLITAGLSGSAMADDFFFKPTVGADYQFTHIDYEDAADGIAADNVHGINFHVGARVHKNLGFEAGYLKGFDKTEHNFLGSGLDSKLNVSGFNLDVLGYLPVAEKVELIGTVGVTRLKSELEITGLGSADDKETKGRIGAGAQVWLTPNSNLRGIVRYQGADFDGDVKHAIVGNLGLNYQF